MKLASVSIFAVIAACNATPSPVVKTPTSSNARTSEERAHAIAIGDAGDLARAVAMIDALDASDPATRSQTWGRDVWWLAELSKCEPALALASMIESSGNAGDKTAARAARDECARLSRTPTADELAAMRTKFHQGTAVEAADPASALKSYVDAWSTAPTDAVILGIARAAKAHGDSAIARAAFQRALAFAELRTKDIPRVAATPDGTDDATREPGASYTGNARALYAMSGTDKDPMSIAVYDLASGAASIDVAFGEPLVAIAISRTHVVLAQGPIASPHDLVNLEIGVDDPHTATPFDLKDASRGVFSPDGSLVALTLATGFAVVDARTGKTLKSDTKRGGNVIGFSADGKALVVEVGSNLKILRAPTWDLPSEDDPALVGARAADVAGHFVALKPDMNSFRVYDLDKKKVVADIKGHFRSVGQLAISPDGARMLAVSYSKTSAWDVARGASQFLEPLYGRMEFTPDGAHVVGSLRGIFTSIDSATVLTHDPAIRKYPFEQRAASVAFAPHGHVLYGGGTGVVRRIDLDTPSASTWFADDFVLSLLVSPNAEYVATSSSRTLAIYDANGAVKARTAGGEMFVPTRFDGSTLVAYWPAMEVKLDAVTGKSTTRHIDEPAPDPESQATSPDGTMSAQMDDAGRIRIRDKSGAPIARIEIGKDFAIVTSSDGAHVQIVGDESRARCVVGATWMPLDVCRDRLLTSDVVAKLRAK